ncbi:hypothetical protein ZIOFF_019241 [Zingiber officinale]|uniref:Hexosyltransferase n=1 Tax=Zingiber officinale TaxID=94328 RepID=A0A8J5HRD3_ZINOF|nr:hypothetical protein ZIOFF_019241 [Zingiber officinale]
MGLGWCAEGLFVNDDPIATEDQVVLDQVDDELGVKAARNCSSIPISPCRRLYLHHRSGPYQLWQVNKEAGIGSIGGYGDFPAALGGRRWRKECQRRRLSPLCVASPFRRRSGLFVFLGGPRQRPHADLVGYDKLFYYISKILKKLNEGMQERRSVFGQQDEEAIVRLENVAIERSKAVDSAVLGKYSIWRKESEHEYPDAKVRFMRDQIIMGRIYTVLAKSKNKMDLYQELLSRIKDSQRVVGEANADADLHHSAPEKIKTMGQVLSKAREALYDCKTVTQRLRAMLQSADEQVRSLKKQSTFLSQLAAKTIPNGINCLSMRLTIEYYLLPVEKRKFPKSENLENPDFYHYALFSDNVLAASVVVNSTIMNAKEPEKHVFHLVTDKLNFGAMNMWFLLNPPGKATIHVENVDDFKWLNSSYCPVLRQLESAAMKEYYFKADHPSAGSSNLKYRNPKYLSMLNHLRFYLPEVYPKLDKILFLDDDIVVQKDLTALWSVDLNGNVNGAVETCGESFHRFNKYLNFSNPHISSNFDSNACGWAYGMNMFDLKEWKKKDITGIYHKWQSMNEDRVLWKLGTLPPGLLTFYKLTYPLDKSWHVLGLGYNPTIDRAEIENAAVVHYNGNMKPWLELAMTRYRTYWTKYINYEHPYIKTCKLSE